MTASSPVIPKSYAQWRNCIEVECGLALTPAFVAERIEALTQPGSEEALRFARLYGAEHFERVIGWFHSARFGVVTSHPNISL